MLKFVFGKIINKKWMVISLLIGGILLVGIATCNPMYVNGALQKLLVSNLDIEYASTGEYPIMIECAKAFNTKDGDYTELRNQFINKIDEDINVIDLEKVAEMEYYHGQYSTFISDKHPQESVTKSFMELGYIKNMEDHINIISGRMNTDNVDDGAYEVIVSEAAFNKNSLVLDEIVTLETLLDSDKEPVKLKIVGIYEAKENELFWIKTPTELDWQCFLTEKAYEDVNNKLFPSKNTYGPITVDKYVLYDYSKIKYEDIYDIAQSAQELVENKYTCNFINKFKDYSDAKKKIVSTMNILQVPTFFLLAIFIYMVSSQMLSMESNEIAMLKSRGASRMQIIFTYLLQSSILAAVSLVIGIPVGYIFCKVVGVSNSFMEFVGRKELPVSINLSTIGYSFMAALFLILVMTLPVIPISKTTIVEHKQKKNSNKAFWKKIFLDIVLLILSLYGYYNFNQQKEIIVKKVIEGSALDPLLFLCSSLFILSCAMITVRIIPLIIGLIYKIGKSKWSTATYTAFLQIIRTTDKQDFIIIFLVLTIAFGIFNANIARTININEENRIWNNNGADLVLKEEWKSNIAVIKRAKIDNKPIIPALTYEEPDIWKYDDVSDNMLGMTKVFNEIGIKSRLTGASKITLDNVQLMGINTKEFGEIAWMRDGALDKHWYHYLNDMAPSTDNILVSANMRDKLGVKIGDTISYTRYNEVGKMSGTGNGIVCGFVNEWPSYSSLYEKISKDGSISYEERYLIVANFDQVMSSFGVTPYEIWVDNKDDAEYMYNYIAENNIRLITFNDSENDLVKMKNDPVFQETNGMLTISFIIVLILCTVGFLIYWIFSIKSRELLFGIYRAMGLSLKEIIKMLLFEHLFSSVFAIIVGSVVGVIATYLFVPLIELAYSVNLMESNVYMSPIDMIRLAVVILLMLAICMYILGKILSTLKISQALKLGEE